MKEGKGARWELKGPRGSAVAQGHWGSCTCWRGPAHTRGSSTSGRLSAQLPCSVPRAPGAGLQGGEVAQRPCTDFTLSMISKEVLQREKAIGKSLLVIGFLPWGQGGSWCRQAGCRNVMAAGRSWGKRNGTGTLGSCHDCLWSCLSCTARLQGAAPREWHRLPGSCQPLPCALYEHPRMVIWLAGKGWQPETHCLWGFAESGHFP